MTSFFFQIFRRTLCLLHPFGVNTKSYGGPWGCCFIFPFLSGTHGKFFKLNVKLLDPVDIGAPTSAIRFFRDEDRLSGKKKLPSHNLAQNAAASLLARSP